jgi:DNA-binding MarR family transcriptional regulator
MDKCQSAADDVLPNELAPYWSWLLSSGAHILSSNVGCALASVKLSFRSFSILSVLSHSPASSQSELAQQIGLDKTTMMAALDHLEAEKLLRRENSSKDRRVRMISLTAKGEKRLEQARKLTQEREEQALSGLNKKEKTELYALLSKLEQSLHQQDTAGSCI